MVECKIETLKQLLFIPVVVNSVCPKCGDIGRCEPTLSEPDGKECDCD